MTLRTALENHQVQIQATDQNPATPPAARGDGRWSGVMCAAADLPSEGSAVFEVDDRRIAVFAVDGVHYAIDDYCTHGQSSLSEDGEVKGLVVTCGLHRAQFDVTNGQVQRGPTRISLRSYSIVVEDGSVRATERPIVEKKRREMGGGQ